MQTFVRWMAAAALVVLSACGGGGNQSPPPPATYKLAGTITGLTLPGMQLSDGTETISVPAGANTFSFAHELSAGASYTFSIATQPGPTLSCSVAGSFPATMPAADVNSLSVACVPALKTYSLGGTVTGLTLGGMQLSNGTETVAIPQGATSSSFAQRLTAGTQYSFSIATQPGATLWCSVGGTSPATMPAADVSSLSVTCVPAPHGIVTTLAGNGSAISRDGVGLAAQFAAPWGTAIDAQGNLYIADGQTVRKITPAGAVSTLAGDPNVEADTDGVGSAAHFKSAWGLAVDAAGNVFVADAVSNKIKKITPAGVVTTFAGSGQAGSADGAGTAASFNVPIALAFDSRGNLFVADLYNYKLRVIAPDATVTTFPVIYNPPDGSRLKPNAIAFDGQDTIYVANGDRIIKITSNGVASLFAGGTYGSADGAPGMAGFHNPEGIALGRDGNLYVAETYTHLIRKVTPDGTASTLSGQTDHWGYADGPLESALFNSPMGVTVTASGDIVIAEYGGRRVRKIMLPK